MRKTMILFALAAVAAALPASASAQRYTLRCESRYDRRDFCRADTSGGVELIRRLSDAPCRRGSTWGVENGGIWVSDGCRGEFAIGRSRGYGGDDGYGRSGDGRYRDGRSGDGRGNGRYGEGRYGDGRGWDDRNGRGSRRWAARAEAQCRRAVQRYLGGGYGGIDTWVRRERSNSVDVDWRTRRRSGSCNVEWDGRTRVHVNGGHGLLDILRGW